MEDVTEETTAIPTANGEGEVRLVLRGILPGDDLAVALDELPLVLGRGDDAGVKLPLPRVSRRHAELARTGRLVSIRDLGSTNGTFLNGERVTHAPLAPGALLRIGNWLGTVEERPANAAIGAFSEVAPNTWGGRELAHQVELLKKASLARLPVVLIGKTGTGKERLALAYHHFGGERRPFRAINCAAIPPQMAEAELFGYRKGAFTGADRSYDGQLTAANGGTLFLDEIAELPLGLQAKLLRALDSGEIARLGESASVRFDAAVVAACQTPLSELVAAGRFREDLAARLGGLTLRLPALRERRADVPRLFDMFLRRHSAGTAPRVSTRLYERLCLHDWPGNVRELELLARQLLAMNGLEPVLRRSHLPESWQRSDAPDTVADRNERDARNLAAALKQSSGNVRLAAQAAGISRQRAYRLMASRQLGESAASSREPDSEELDD